MAKITCFQEMVTDRHWEKTLLLHMKPAPENHQEQVAQQPLPLLSNTTENRIPT